MSMSTILNNKKPHIRTNRYGVLSFCKGDLNHQPQPTLSLYQTELLIKPILRVMLVLIYVACNSTPLCLEIIHH